MTCMCRGMNIHTVQAVYQVKDRYISAMCILCEQVIQCQCVLFIMIKCQTLAVHSVIFAKTVPDGTRIEIPFIAWHES